MTDNTQKATQIAINFGPVNGNVLQQHIHPIQPPQPTESCSSDSGYSASSEQSQPSDTSEKPESTESRKQLSISQAVILFSALLGEPLEQGFGKHKTKLAELISAVTGYSAGSIRQKIMEIGKMNVYPHNIQQDAEIVEKLIKPYNAQIASDIQITYLDE